MDRYMYQELEPSATSQLDIMGMQPHAREYLEYEINCGRSERKFQMIEGYVMDYVEGIHFGDTP
jgi:hypothetical protein